MKDGVRLWKNRESLHITLYVLVTSVSFMLSQASAQESTVPFDVVDYDIALSLPMTSEALSGTSAMTMHLTAPTDSIMIHALALTIDSVSANGAPAPFALVPASEALVVRLGSLHQAGDTVHVRVVYRRLPDTPRPSGRIGYYYYPAGTTDGTSPALGYTMSEPSDARAWLPCYDDPSDKATATIAITVPSAYVAGSNGRLISVTGNGDGTSTWRWREDHQVATYLMCATVSQFAVPTQPFVRAAGDTIPLQYFVWPVDSARAARYLPTVNLMVRALSDLYGPYPFDKYAMSAVTPFNFGGMEHQTFTTMARNAMDAPSVVSHELAHQWWGDLVTCATWKDIWLNESFASYSEALWDERVNGSLSLQTSMLHRLHLTATSWRNAVYDPEGQGSYLFSDAVYSKGAWVLHTLRGVTGDSIFFHALAAYRQKFAGRSATTADFVAVFDSVAGRSMGWFFDQWIYGKGFPQYAFGYSWASDTLQLSIEQQQDPSWPTFRMPLQVRVWHGGTDTLITVQDSLRSQRFSIPFAVAPDSVKLDPDNWVLKQVTQVTGVEETSEIPKEWKLEQNRPNPFNPSTVIGYTIGEGKKDYGTMGRGDLGRRVLVQLSVYDILGREVAVLVNEPQRPGRYSVRFDGSRLASGAYIYRLEAEGVSLAKRMTLVK